jgi:hypothetical protein
LFLSRDSGSFYCKSQKDKNVSSLHAKLNALVEAVKMVIYYRESLEELHFRQTKPTTVHIDNEGVIAELPFYVKSFGKDNRSIYLINKINFVRECVDKNIIKLEFVNSENNLADLCTISLDVHQHHRLLEKVLKGSIPEPKKSRLLGSRIQILLSTTRLLVIDHFLSRGCVGILNIYDKK